MAVPSITNPIGAGTISGFKAIALIHLGKSFWERRALSSAVVVSVQQMKAHTILVIGNRDMEANAISLRVHGKGNLGAKPRAEVIADILQSIAGRRG